MFRNKRERLDVSSTIMEQFDCLTIAAVENRLFFVILRDWPGAAAVKTHHPYAAQGLNRAAPRHAATK